MIPPLARLVAVLTFVSFASPALAAPGLRLSWDHCAAGGRVANAAFACDTNVGSRLLVLSFEPPVSKTDCIALEMQLHIRSSDSVMPAWWQFSPTGACRASMLGTDLSPTSAGSCQFPYGPVSGAGIGAYTAGLLGPGSWGVVALSAVPSDQPFAVTAGVEHFAVALVLRNLKTVGTGACGGCGTPMCIGFGRLQIEDAQNTGNILMNAGAPNLGGSDATVTWQGAYVREYTTIGGPAHPLSLTCDPDASSPARRSTWGAVKSLYR